MLDDVQDQIRAWLERKPTISALEVLRRLRLDNPERFADKHLRTVQRAVKAWRGQQARRFSWRVPSPSRWGYAMRGSRLWTPWTTRHQNHASRTVTSLGEAIWGVSFACRLTTYADITGNYTQTNNSTLELEEGSPNTGVNPIDDPFEHLDIPLGPAATTTIIRRPRRAVRRWILVIIAEASSSRPEQESH